MVIVADTPIDFFLENSGAHCAPIAHYATFSQGDFDHYMVTRGSGGNVVPDLRFSGTGAMIVLEPQAQQPLSGALNQIENAFGLNREELAEVCKTTRKTIYNWLGGASTPHKKNLHRLFDLLVVARDWFDAGFPGNRTKLHQPVVDDQSIFHLLCANSVDRELILFAGSRLALAEPTATPIPDPFD